MNDFLKKCIILCPEIILKVSFLLSLGLKTQTVRWGYDNALYGTALVTVYFSKNKDHNHLNDWFIMGILLKRRE